MEWATSFPRANCTFHIITSKTIPTMHNRFVIYGDLTHLVYHAPTSMKLGEFMEQIGVLEDQPVRERATIREVMEQPKGSGQWTNGKTFSLGMDDASLGQTLHDIGWNHTRGEAGQAEPVWIIRNPAWIANS